MIYDFPAHFKPLKQYVYYLKRINGFLNHNMDFRFFGWIFHHIPKHLKIIHRLWASQVARV